MLRITKDTFEITHYVFKNEIWTRTKCHRCITFFVLLWILKVGIYNHLKIDVSHIFSDFGVFSIFLNTQVHKSIPTCKKNKYSIIKNIFILNRAFQLNGETFPRVTMENVILRLSLIF